MRNVVCCLCCLLVTQWALASPPTVQVGRYTTMQAVPTAAQKDPLLTLGTFHFGVSVTSVGEAIAQVLRPTGFHLVPLDHLPSVAQAVLTKPLPYSQRHLGPLRIQDALRVLMGEAVFTLVVDPVHRLVSFRVKPRFLSHHSLHRRHRA